MDDTNRDWMLTSEPNVLTSEPVNLLFDKPLFRGKKKICKDDVGV